MQEVEWRFDASDLAAVEAWLSGRNPREAPAVSVSGESRTKVLSDTYFDTEDWRVFRAGYALRARKVEGRANVEVTLKSLASEGGDTGEERRREISETHTGEGASAVEAARGSRSYFGELLRSFAGAREMREVFALRNRRRTFDLLLREATEDNGELVVDASGDIRGSQPSADSAEAGNGGATDGRISVDAEGNIREREPGEGSGGYANDERSENEIVVDAQGDIREASDASDEGTANDAGAETEDRVVGEVALDDTEISLGEGEEPARLFRVEVEASADEADSASELLGEFVGEMREELALKPTRLSKYAAGLYATGQSPAAATDLGPTRIDDSLTLGELAFAILRRQFAKMRACEPGSRIGQDPEEVHDMRVATRRMRAAIKLFKKALPGRAQHLRDELKWVATFLGDVRDADVQLERLEEWSSKADDDAYREALSRASRALERQREEARGRMFGALDSARYRRFETSFAQMLKLGPRGESVPGAPPDEDSISGEPAAVAGRKLLSRSYRKWRELADGLGDESSPDDYHEVRKEGKRLRYALEFFSGVYGEDATDALVKPLKTVQDDLGLHQDDIIAADWLRDLATGGHSFPARAAFFVGMLAGDLLREAAEIRAGTRENEAFRAVADGKEWKGFEKTASKSVSKADYRADGAALPKGTKPGAKAGKLADDARKGAKKRKSGKTKK